MPPGDDTGDATVVGTKVRDVIALMENTWRDSSFVFLDGDVVFALIESARSYSIYVNSTRNRFTKELESYVDARGITSTNGTA